MSVPPHWVKPAAVPPDAGANASDELIRVAETTGKRLCARRENLLAHAKYLSEKDDAMLIHARGAIDRPRPKLIAGGIASSVGGPSMSYIYSTSHAGNQGVKDAPMPTTQEDDEQHVDITDVPTYLLSPIGPAPDQVNLHIPKSIHLFLPYMLAYPQREHRLQLRRPCQI